MKIEEVKCDFKIIEEEKEEGFSLASFKKGEKIISFDDDITANVIDEVFNHKYRDLLYLIAMNSDEDGESDENMAIALIKLDELQKFIKSVLPYLKKGKKEELLKKGKRLEDRIYLLMNKREKRGPRGR